MQIFNRGKRFLAAAAAAVTAAASIPAVQVSAADTASIEKIVVLGDSISAGYAVEEGEYGYYDYLGDFYNAEITNYAVSGSETGDVLKALQTTEVQTAVKKANMICLSIGGNDLMHPLIAYFQTLQKDGETVMDTIQRILDSGNAKDYIAKIIKLLREPIANAQANYVLIEEEIRALNADAPIMMQTIYNPLDLPPYMMSARSEEEQGNYKDFAAFVAGQEGKLNDAIMELETVTPVDVYSAFKGNGWMLVRIFDKDIHPTLLGHLLIAELTAQASGIGTNAMYYTRIGDLIYDLKQIDYLCLKDENLQLLARHSGGGTYDFGDVIGDGEIQLNDAMAALTIYACGMVGLPNELTVRQNKAAAVDLEAGVSLGDAIVILNYYAYNTLAHDDVTWYELTGNPDAPDAPKN